MPRMTASRAAVAAWALLLAAACVAPCRASAAAAQGGTAAAAAAKRTFGFRIRSRDFQPTFRRSLLRNTTIPLHGAVKDFGYFYATLYLGTPPRKFAVIVDTGSTMTYVPCATCGDGCGPNHQDAAFDPEASSTAVPIPCGSPKCTCGSPRCGCSRQQCTYSRSYAEQSSSSGVLLEDVIALHDGQPGAPIIFGCETRETGEIYKQRADGLFGLGNSDASVVNQLVRAGVIDDVFSLCFGMVEGDGALLLGDAELPGSVALQYTPLLSSPSHPFYYNVRMLSLSVDGQLLPVAQSLFEEGYGTVLDSGTTFTYVPTPVFKAFAAAVDAYALARGLQRVPGPDPQYSDLCWGGAPPHDDLEALSAVFPPIDIQFDQGTLLVLGPLNYLFVHTFNSGKYCLGVFDNGRAGTLLGGITFRNVLVRYDRANRRVGFGPAPCKELGEMQRPPCSFFGADGGATDLAAAAAAQDGDCSPGEEMRQQQQEPFEDGSGGGGSGGGGSSDAAAGSSGGGGGEPAAQRRPPGDHAGAPTGQPSEDSSASASSASGGGDAAAATGQQQDQAAATGDGASGQEAPPIAPPENSRDAAPAATAQQEQASSGGGGGGGGGLSAGVSVALGLAVAVVAVAALGAVVALLQPATRDRLRAALAGRQYRSLEDEEMDPEGGVPPALATLAPPGGGNGGVGAAAAVELAGNGGGGRKSVELGPLSDPASVRRGLTTPTKLQRTVSNVSDDSGAAALNGGVPTPRSASAAGQATPRQGSARSLQ